jgi:serine/threonine protein kinase
METASSKTSLESRYRVQWNNPLGEGAFGAVYIGMDVDTGDRVAIKKISKDYTDNITFQREMDALLFIRKQGGHPNICGMRENFDQGPWYYIVLDLVAGGEMFDHLVSEGPYSEADAARLVQEVASALAFLHGIGVVHGDLKPENLMLSSPISSEAVIKVVDFGTAQVLALDEDDIMDEGFATPNPIRNGQQHRMIANTPAYSPPEALKQKYHQSNSTTSSFLGANNKTSSSSAMAAVSAKQDTNSNNNNSDNLEPSFDMWGLGVILYIMLTGIHPFDLAGNSSDEDVEHRILTHQAPPLYNSPITAHLSDSAKDLIDKLMNWDPKQRLTALQMLEHPWVRGETARTGKIADSDKRLSSYRVFKSKLAAQVFSDLVSFSSEEGDDGDENDSNNHSNNDSSNNNFNGNGGGHEEIAKRTSLLERSFHKFDPGHKGYISTGDLRRLTKTNPDGSKESTTKDGSTPPSDKTAGGGSDSAEEEQLSMTGFSNLLAENMKNKFWPKGHVVYREGDVGNAMFFINSGSIEVSTQEGHTSIRRQGENFGEGALLHPKRIRSATVRCVTPVHAIEISREYFEKFIAEESGLKLNLREKDRTRKRQRAKTILRLQQNMKDIVVKQGDYIFRAGEEGHELYILEEGKIDVLVEDHKVFGMNPGDICGEHSLIMGRPRNTSTKCVSEGGCKLHVMKDKDFFVLLDAMPAVRESLRDMCLRREFQKALVYRTKKEFPTQEHELKEAFDAADESHQGVINLNNVQHMLKQMDPTFSDQDIEEILLSLDLDDSGEVDFTEFKRIFSFEPTRRKTSGS